MGDHHRHNHSEKNIGFAFALNAVFTVIEFIGGYFTGSVAILADAFHDLGDTITLAMAYVMERVSRKESSEEYSYGYRRYSLLGALISGLVLFSGSMIVMWEALPQLINPKGASAEGMFAIAVVGIFANGLAFFRLKHGHSENESMMKWHLFEDLAGWVAVLFASVIMYFFEVPWLDPLLAILVAVFIVMNVIRNLRRIFGIFLQGTPKDFDLASFRLAVTSIQGVGGLHDIHCWTLDGINHVVSLHVVVASGSDHKEIKTRIRSLKIGKDSTHFTIEVEESETLCNSCDEN